MSQAESLLNQMARSGMYTASPATEPHIVVGMDRMIVVPDELKRLGVQFDHNIETVTFDCPRYWDDTDMSKMNVYINYERKDGARGQYLADNVSVDTDDETMMHFEWKISKFVTLTDGPIKFNVCTKSIDDGGNEEEHWNSELCEDCYISPGLESGSVIEGAYPDIITQLRTKMDNILNSGMAVDVTMQKVDDELIVNIVAPEGTEEFRIYDGKTPFIGANGNWWIGNKDTGVVAQASTDGFMPATVYDPQGKKTDIFQYVIDNGVSAADRQKWDAKSNFSGSYTDLTNKPTLFDGKYSSLSGKPTLFDGKYSSLTGKPTIPTVVDSVGSTSTTSAASANAVRQAYNAATNVSPNNISNLTWTSINLTNNVTELDITTKELKVTKLAGIWFIYLHIYWRSDGVQTKEIPLTVSSDLYNISDFPYHADGLLLDGNNGEPCAVILNQSTGLSLLYNEPKIYGSVEGIFMRISN